MLQPPPRDRDPPSAPRLRRFDMHAFHCAHSKAKGLSWAELAVQTKRPFEGTTSIPIPPVTLRDMLRMHSVTSAVVLPHPC